jgi:hypothetical protein
MTDSIDATPITLSNGYTMDYATLDAKLEERNLLQLAQDLKVTATELMQVLKARPRS